MELTAQQRARHYIHARFQHPAWQMLAARRGPLVLSCLQTLFEDEHQGVGMEDAIEALAGMFREFANQPEFEILDENHTALARRELRGWIKRGLVVEREGQLHATDALEEALRFVGALEGRIMTSTASRLSVVQREVENLETALNPDQQSRAVHLRRRIAALEQELVEVEAGRFEVLDDEQAIEAIRELYALASGLRADFRRVEDSWRQADRQLRQTIISEQGHRGSIVDSLLDGHEALLETPEGRVFQAFYQQLQQPLELERMKERLRIISRHPMIERALARPQQVELRWLSMRLVKESRAVIRARARSERDVKSFLKTGLASEHHRVGALLNEIFAQALQLDWGCAALRRRPGPLPPVAPALAGLPLIERLRFKNIDSDEALELELAPRHGDLAAIEDDFWLAFDGLDREALLEQTLVRLEQHGGEMGLAELAAQLEPKHDLETLAFWLGMVREAGLSLEEGREHVEISGEGEERWRYHLPKVRLSSAALAGIDWGEL
ncbi:MAG: DUF3375 domain-containing protein [Thiohalomonadaceae bacterium]